MESTGKPKRNRDTDETPEAKRKRLEDVENINVSQIENVVSMAGHLGVQIALQLSFSNILDLCSVSSIFEEFCNEWLNERFWRTLIMSDLHSLSDSEEKRQVSDVINKMNRTELINHYKTTVRVKGLQIAHNVAKNYGDTMYGILMIDGVEFNKMNISDLVEVNITPNDAIIQWEQRTLVGVLNTSNFLKLDTFKRVNGKLIIHDKTYDSTNHKEVTLLDKDKLVKSNEIAIRDRFVLLIAKQSSVDRTGVLTSDILSLYDETNLSPVSDQNYFINARVKTPNNRQRKQLNPSFKGACIYKLVSDKTGTFHHLVFQGVITSRLHSRGFTKAIHDYLMNIPNRMRLYHKLLVNSTLNGSLFLYRLGSDICIYENIVLKNNSNQLTSIYDSKTGKNVCHHFYLKEHIVEWLQYHKKDTDSLCLICKSISIT